MSEKHQTDKQGKPHSGNLVKEKLHPGGLPELPTRVFERPIYNVHVHFFTIAHVPPDLLALQLGKLLGRVVGWLLRWRTFARLFTWIVRRVNPFNDNDILDRQARLFEAADFPSQQQVYERIQAQYPSDAVFVALPMNMSHIGLGTPRRDINEQHAELLELARKSRGRVIPFFAADPRDTELLQKARRALGDGGFRGVKIYPNLGYLPNDNNLMPIYELCQERNLPVMSHCSPGGLWAYGMTEADRLRYGHPRNYEAILRRFPQLRLCLAHFGGLEQWLMHLKAELPRQGEQRSWVRWISDMLRSGDFPNLYTDISYTVFRPHFRGLYLDLFDYLKVLLADTHIRRRVLFGSDYYMVARELLSEKEVSILLRSRLGEEIYFEIAHHNPLRYLGIDEQLISQ